MRTIKNPEVAAVFATYPAVFRRKLLTIRKIILDTAESTEGVGPIEETLKWGEPAYLTTVTKSGSTIRLDWKKAAPTQYAVYFNCHSNLVDMFRSVFPDVFAYEGNRKIVFEANDVVPVEELSFCIAAALTYHLNNETRH